MKRYAFEWINEWCTENGWTDLFEERRNFWAFPPGAVMPEPIPLKVLKAIKAEKGFTAEEKAWSLAAIATTLSAGITAYYSASPMPIVMAFAACAFIVAQFDEEDGIYRFTPNTGDEW